MSTKFTPFTNLLDDIYIPFFEKIKKNSDFKLDSFTIEPDSDGVMSIINLNTDAQKFIPYIDTSKYDFDRKDWFYYNEEGLPFRLTYATTNWLAEPVYGVPVINASTSSLTIPLLFNKDVNIQLGLYIEVSDGATTHKLYKGVPMSIAIENIPVTDITDYSNPNIIPTLTKINTLVNREFYYDFNQNRIFTNQNLEGFTPLDVIIGFYSSITSVSIKCRLSSNESTPSDITPVVDYYIAKLSGQNLRG